MINLIYKFSEFLSKNMLWIKKFFIIFALLFISLSCSADVGDRIYFGFNGITEQTAFQYRSPNPTQYGHNSVVDFGGTIGNAKFAFIQKPIHLDITDIPIGADMSIGFKFLKMNYNTGQPVQPLTYGCPNVSLYTQGGYDYPFYMQWNLASEVSDWNDLEAANPIGGNSGGHFWLMPFQSARSVQPDGTCLISFGTKNNETQFPVGDYYVVIGNPEALASVYDPQLQSNEYWTILGNNKPRNQKELVCLSDKTMDFRQMTYACTQISLVNNFIGDNFVNLDFFIQQDTTPPIIPDPPAVNYCNPFVNDITTLFINYNFSLSQCTSDIFSYLIIPSGSSLEQFNGLYETVIHKPPFGYVVAINDTLNEIILNNTEPNVFQLESMDILNEYIFDPINIGLTMVLWIAFAFILFHRLKNIDL